MSVFGHLFGRDEAGDVPGLLDAIERAVNGVEPLLRQTGDYPEGYRKSVETALKYAHGLALSVPGPVVVNNESYARDIFVHAIFPCLDCVLETFRTSRAVQEYLLKFPQSGEIYALMGMRRQERSMMGIAFSGEVIQRDVPQNVVYFTSHTIESLASSEQQAREQVAWSFFDRLVGKVAQRVKVRKQAIQARLQQRDDLLTRLHEADANSRPSLEASLAWTLGEIKSGGGTLEFHAYLEEFQDVLLNPQAHLRLNTVQIELDSMGVKKPHEAASAEQSVIFNDLIGFDKRDWTVTMVRCSDIQVETFSARLEDACRRLSI